MVSVSWETKHEKSSKIRGEFGENLGEKSGRKFEKFRELSFCNFSDLKKKRGKIRKKTVTKDTEGLVNVD